jgi:hypothetical protein
VLATNALLPAALSRSELEERNEVEARALRIIDLLLGGVSVKGPLPLARRAGRKERKRTVLQK